MDKTQQQQHNDAATPMGAAVQSFDTSDTAGDYVMGEPPCQPDAAGNTDQAPQERGALPTTAADTLAMIRRQAQTGVTPDTAESTDGSAAPDALPTINVDDLTAPAWDNDPYGDIVNYFAATPMGDTWGMIGDRPALPRQGVIQIDAKPKQGKSFAALAIAVALLGDAESFANLTPMGDRPKCIIIADTEMSSSTLQRRGRGVYNTIGDTATRRLITLQLAKYPAAERWDRLQKYVATYNPDILVIDNLTNMLPNVNDQNDASFACEQLATMSSTRTIIAVIHQNKSQEDTSATGAIGSKLTQMAVERYTAKRQNGVFYLMPVIARDTEIPDGEADRKQMSLTFAVAKDEADPLSIAKFVDGKPMANRAAEEEAAKWRQQFATIFADTDTLTRGEMRTRLMERYGYGDRAADTAITNAVKAGVISKTGNGLRDPYKLVLR